MKENACKNKDFYYGVKTEKLLRKLLKGEDREVAAGFMRKLHTAYMTTATYVHTEKVNSKLLLLLTGLDPSIRGKTLTYKLLKKLGSFFQTMLNSEDKQESFLKEINKYQFDDSLTMYDEKTMQLDEWWGQVFKSEDYQSLGIVVRACISIFTAPNWKVCLA